MSTLPTLEKAVSLEKLDTAPVTPVEKSRDPAGPTDERTVHILRLLEKGFFTDSTRYLLQEQELKSAVQQAQSLGADTGSPNEWNELWHQRWDDVNRLLGSISDLNRQMNDHLSSSDSSEVETARRSWQSILSHDEQLATAMGHLRTQASNLEPEAQKNWNILARNLEKQIETLQSCSHALALRLELMQRHTKTEVDQMLKALVAQLPKNTATEQATRAAIDYAEEYDDTVAELKREQHQPLGMFDVVKNMFMWTESPHERLNQKKSLRTD